MINENLRKKLIFCKKEWKFENLILCTNERKVFKNLLFYTNEKKIQEFVILQEWKEKSRIWFFAKMKEKFTTNVFWRLKFSNIMARILWNWANQRSLIFQREMKMQNFSYRIFDTFGWLDFNMHVSWSFSSQYVVEYLRLTRKARVPLFLWKSRTRINYDYMKNENLTSPL